MNGDDEAQLRDMALLAAEYLRDQLDCEGYIVITIRNTPTRGGSSQALVSNLATRGELVRTLRWLADDTERQLDELGELDAPD